MCIGLFFMFGEHIAATTKQQALLRKADKGLLKLSKRIHRVHIGTVFVFFGFAIIFATFIAN